MIKKYTQIGKSEHVVVLVFKSRQEDIIKMSQNWVGYDSVKWIYLVENN